MTAALHPVRRGGPPRRALALACLLSAVGSLALACSDEKPARPLSPLAQQGQKLYMNVCIACHNANPNLDGAIGPANAGSSEELLAAKILRGEYPPGYTPKRPGSHAMPRFEYLADQIPALAAYLKEVKEVNEVKE
jgi:mono/diheme cytochrome c family protein